MTESMQDLTRKPFNEEKSLYYEQNHCQKAFEASITMRRFVLKFRNPNHIPFWSG